MKAFRNKLSKLSQKSAGFTLVEIMIVVLIIGILLAIAIPNFVNAREASRAKACVANLKQIDSAKQQYLMDNNSSSFTSVTQASKTDTLGGLVGRYIRTTPNCPAGGNYITGDQTTVPSCSLGTVSINGNNYPHALQ